MDHARFVPGVLALSGFLVALLSGLVASNPASGVLMRALLAMVVCLVVGEGVAMVMRGMVKDFTDKYRTEHPIPAAVDSADGGSAKNL